MSRLGAGLFAWVQAAPAYADLHARAVALLPEGRGRAWLDVGCGPGLVARLAAERGYLVRGLDRDPAMVRAARHRAAHLDTCRFAVGDVDGLAPDAQADVVSAASLLVVLPDPGAGLQRLWQCVRPGGHLLVVEATAGLTLANVRRLRSRASSRLVLALWAWMRQGRSLDPRIFDRLPAATAREVALLDGLVAARVYGKPD